MAGWGTALLMLVSPAASSVEPNAFVEIDVPSASAALGTTQDQIKIRPEDQAAYQPEGQAKNQADDDAQMPARQSALDPVEPPSQTPAGAELFGPAAAPVESGQVLTKWTGVEADIQADNEVLDRCRASMDHCPEAARNFLAIVAEGRAQTGRARIGVINRAINFAIRPMSDLAQWGVPDRWSSPLETFTTGRGDCEDYAIAKYVALTRAGVAAVDVKLVIVHDLAVAENHAVVAVRLNDDWIVLDNRWLTLVAYAKMPRTVPLFVLDGDGVKKVAPLAIAGTPSASAASGDAASALGALREQH